MSIEFEPRNKKAETPSMRETAYLADRLYAVLAKEDIFPKRSRWLFAGKLADLMADIQIAIEEANRPEVQTVHLRIRRYELQQIALGKLSALSRLLSQAQRSLHINPDRLEQVAGSINTLEKYIYAWINSDRKRYGPVEWPHHNEGDVH